MKVHKLDIGTLFWTNCYIIELDDKKAVAVDIGDEPDRILEFLSDNGLELKKILLTHGHFDHVYGVEKVRKTTGAEVFIHEADAPKLMSAEQNFGINYGLPKFYPVEQFNKIIDGAVIKEGNTEFKVMHTPGHTEGGVCYICDNVIFSGDTLFRRSMGRTDFPDGNSDKLLASLQKLCKLEGNYIVYPGHNLETELDYERRNNPYMAGL
jgi:glyoxylase-like metal-dependent hydrolase (beta-lactamase superfamily II)